MVEFWCVSSRIVWVMFMLGKVKVCVVVVSYGSTELDDEERESL